MRTHTTCAGCGEDLLVERAGQGLHDHCPPPGNDPVHAWLAQLTDLDQAFRLQDWQLDALIDRIDAYDQRPPDHRGAAMAYAAWGWPVFPCAPGRKTPLTTHGFHEATTDTEQIHLWWRHWPNANVATPTGHRFDVLDIDPQGYPWWAGERAADTDLDIHGIATTPRGGLHLYLQATGDGNLAGLAPGVDYRGRGGYVLLPPATLVPGAVKGPLPRWPLRYHWNSKPSPLLTQPTQWDCTGPSLPERPA